MKKSILIRGCLSVYKYPCFLLLCRGETWIKLRRDASRYLRTDECLLSKFMVFSYLILNKNLASIFLFRIKQNRILYFICSFLYCHNRNIEILTPPHMVGGGLVIYHNIGSILRAKSIGNDVTISQGVTIGAGGDWQDTRKDNIPTIGDNVLIATNSVVIGDIVVGDNAVIGAGTVVTKNVPDGAVVVGNSQRIIKQK